MHGGTCICQGPCAEAGGSDGWGKAGLPSILQVPTAKSLDSPLSGVPLAFPCSLPAAASGGSGQGSKTIQQKKDSLPNSRLHT
ncbi:hypothetical protein VUR80DRAFT_7003 [Thermomyces stellatus]